MLHWLLHRACFEWVFVYMYVMNYFNSLSTRFDMRSSKRTKAVVLTLRGDISLQTSLGICDGLHATLNRMNAAYRSVTYARRAWWLPAVLLAVNVLRYFEL
jgi:hypothetical protein